MRVRVLLSAVTVAGMALLLTTPAEASLPELKLSPLQYTERLDLGKKKIGFVEASNPTSTKMRVTVEVEAFRQTDNRGSLEYFDDERTASGIIPALKSFELGPRESVRLKFTVDPNKLGPGGTYGVIFLRVDSGNDAASQINTSARVGTLLILNVGGTGKASGQIKNLKAPLIVTGTKPVKVTYDYANTGTGKSALAFAPKLKTSIGWGAKPKDTTGPFVFPGRTRTAEASIAPSNQLGIIPLRLADNTLGRSVTHYRLAATGFWTWLVPVIVALCLGGAASWHWRENLTDFIKRRRSRRRKR